MTIAEARVAGHLGELLQGRLGPSGPVALVTLPDPELRVTARLFPGPFAFHAAGDRPISRGQVAALWRALGGVPRGRLLLRADMPAGGGAGSSTASLLAAARVCTAALGAASPEATSLATLCLALEGASDPLMMPEPARHLWDPRSARTLAILPTLPTFEVVGGFFGPGRRTDPADHDFADIRDLASAWTPAAARGDRAALADLATEAARRTLAHRGGAPLDPFVAAAAACGALGVAIAHTGAARALLFAPGRGDTAGSLALLRALGGRRLHRYRL